MTDNDEEIETGSEGKGNGYNYIDQWSEDGGNMAFDKHWKHVVGYIGGEEANDDEMSDDETGDEMGRSEKGSDEEEWDN